MEDTNLKDEVKKTNEILSKLLESGKVKGVKAKKLSKRELKNKYVRYIYIDENNAIKPMKLPIDEGTTVIDGVPRVATSNYMATWDGQPAIIQFASSVFPLDIIKERDEIAKSQMQNAGYKLLLNKIEQGGLKQKKKLSGAMIFGIVIAILVIGYFIVKRFGG